MKSNKLVKVAAYIIAAGIMTLLMVFNYATSCFNKNNDSFAGFSAGSESLVTAGMVAQIRGLEGEYAIGYYENAFGNAKRSNRGLEYYNKACAGITNDLFDHGYSRTQPGVVILGYNVMTNNVYESGEVMQFADGSEYKINEVTVEGENFYVHLDCDEMLTEETKGMLVDSKVFDANGDEIELERYSSYISHYGLQGSLFGFFTRFFSPQRVFKFSNMFSCLCTALVFVAIVFLLYKKYNVLMAACFYLVFLLAPVIVNFARNLYWVEFTWFIPVLAGLLCSVYYDNKKIRVLSCALAFLSVFAKSLCGYEYISTILIAMMSFLFADFVSSIVKKDREKSLSYFKTMLVMGALAVMGFAVAIVLHASMRGGGNLMAGIAEIWQQDVMRRTLGGDPADFSEIFAASLTASVGDVVKLYLAPQVEIVAGLSGSWFKLLMLLPVPAFALQLIACKKIDVQQAVLYLLTMAAALSWFVLAKSHSYEHTHTLMWQCGISALYSFAFTYR